MTINDDLISRLRERTVTGHHPTALEVEAADALTAAQERERVLREALECIASYPAGSVDAGMSPWTAKAALEKGNPQ